MNGNIALIAALPGELKPLVNHKTARGWRLCPAPPGVKLWEYRHADGCWIAVCAGMGADRATVAFNAAERHASIDAVCSVGWAGSLDERFRPGDVVSASLVVDAQTGERYRVAHWVEGMPILISTNAVAGASEKARLAATYGAGIVDMEAATVARLARAKDIPLYVMKAISDAVDARLPDFSGFMNSAGQLRMPGFLAHVAVRPPMWGSLLRLGRHSSKAAENLAESLYDWLDERGYSRKG
ncbi:MAG TPA: nucleoside phosphorylase [Acidobacteriaceae bacterium]